MSKYLVVCTDGTWNRIKKRGGQLADDNTNVAKIYHAIADTDAQIRYYDEGVGTGADVAEHGALTKTRELFDRVVGGITGWGIEKNIVQGYEFIAKNYAPGDKIIGFGFSRGAYTIRVLAALVGRYGVPKTPSDCGEIYRQCYRKKSSQCLYETHDDAVVEFLGVWDTVGALGVPLGVFRRWIAGRYSFMDLKLGANVRHAYHAVAVDEKRRPFQPALWETAPAAAENNIVQTWFPGVHSDIGGGYLETGLSDIALAWMIENARAKVPALQWTNPPRPIAPNANGKLHESRGAIYLRSWLHPRHRKVTATNQHPQVCKRWDAQEAYRPVNVFCAR